MTINPNDPAMPHPNHEGVIGLSIRAELAARAMQGYMSFEFCPHQCPEHIAEYAVKCADALISELNKTDHP